MMSNVLIRETNRGEERGVELEREVEADGKGITRNFLAKIPIAHFSRTVDGR